MLFGSQDLFGSILNHPLVYKVLKTLWMGNRQYSSAFYRESYHYQVLQPNFRIMFIENKSIGLSPIKEEEEDDYCILDNEMSYEIKEMTTYSK